MGLLDRNAEEPLADGATLPQDVAAPLVVRNLNKRYRGGTWANRDISFTARRGEVLGILGPNGAGKTTLVRQITSELLPTSGEVRIFGHDVVAEPATAKALLGIVPQEANLFEYLSVYQHLRIFGKLRGLPGKDANRRAHELVEELHLTEHRNVMVDKLSGGLRRRVLVGIATLAQAPLLVLNEPTTGLDPRSRRDLWSLLRRYKEQGTTVVLTTHYMEEAETLCDRVGIIHQGQLIALDTLDNLRAGQGYNFKITYSVNGSGEPQTIYGVDDRELVDQVQAKGAASYSVSRTSLEDVYLAMTGDKESTDGQV